MLRYLLFKLLAHFGFAKEENSFYEKKSTSSENNSHLPWCKRWNTNIAQQGFHNRIPWQIGKVGVVRRVIFRVIAIQIWWICMIVMKKIQLYLWNNLCRVRINLSHEGSDKTSNKQPAQNHIIAYDNSSDRLGNTDWCWIILQLNYIFSSGPSIEAGM